MIKGQIGFVGAGLSAMAHDPFMTEKVCDEPIIFTASPLVAESDSSHKNKTKMINSLIQYMPLFPLMGDMESGSLKFNRNPVYKSVGNNQRKRRKLIRQNPSLLRSKKYKRSK